MTMRSLVISAAVLLVVACSSSDDDTPPCVIVGTYTADEARVNGTCPATPDKDTFTLSKSGDNYFIEFAGVTGGCPAEIIGQCKLQSKCDVAVKDPVDPSKDTGTLQVSWTFDAVGFHGSTVLSVPPTAAATTGCTSEYASTATRK